MLLPGPDRLPEVPELLLDGAQQANCTPPVCDRLHFSAALDQAALSRPLCTSTGSHGPYPPTGLLTAFQHSSDSRFSGFWPSH